MSGDDASDPTGQLILQNPDLVSRILASAADLGEPMTVQEFCAWLDAAAPAHAPSSGRDADRNAAGA